MSKEIIQTPQVAVSSSVYHCDECSFTPTIAESLKEHKEDKHRRVIVLNVEPKDHLVADVPPVPESESFEEVSVTVDLVPEIPEANHVNDFEMVVEKLSCNLCDFKGNDTFTLEEHTSSKHENRISDEDIHKLGGPHRIFL